LEFLIETFKFLTGISEFLTGTFKFLTEILKFLTGISVKQSEAPYKDKIVDFIGNKERAYFGR